MWLSLHDVEHDYVTKLGEDTVREVLSYVSSTLEALTGYRYTTQGKITENLTPVPQERGPGGIGPYMRNGVFYNSNCGGCGDFHVFKFGCLPVAHVMCVKINDCELDPSQYCLVDTQTLVVTGTLAKSSGILGTPSQSNLKDGKPTETVRVEPAVAYQSPMLTPYQLGTSLIPDVEWQPMPSTYEGQTTDPIPLGEPQAFHCEDVSACGNECVTVTYICGSGIPANGRHAAKVLATEMLSGMTGGNCQLPERVTSVTRQGMSFTLLDPQDFLDKGRTGLYAVDLFLRAANPRGALRPARVFIPTSRGRSCGCGASCNCGGN